MIKYIIRLDDACPYMDAEKWLKIENLLNKYSIKPIVGIIPDCQDKSFKNEYDENFWKVTTKRWQKNNWIIAQHGLNHNLSDTIRTEFAGKSYDEQYKILKEGYEILIKNKVKVECFFAPNHTFDDNTIKACKELGYYKYISDGYAYYPYEYNDMLFLPNVFDTPHKVSNNGIWTFVYHPNNMNDNDFDYLEKFIKDNKDSFVIDINNVIKNYKKRRRNFKDKLLELAIKSFRKLKGTKR